MRAGWAYFAAWPQTAKDLAQMAQNELTISVLSIAGGKASAVALPSDAVGHNGGDRCRPERHRPIENEPSHFPVALPTNPR